MVQVADKEVCARFKFRAEQLRGLSHLGYPIIQRQPRSRAAELYLKRAAKVKLSTPPPFLGSRIRLNPSSLTSPVVLSHTAMGFEGNPRRLRFLYGSQFVFVFLGKSQAQIVSNFSPLFRCCRASGSDVCRRTENGHVLAFLKSGSSCAYRTVDSFLTFRCKLPL
jgi:hypothetical protein